MRGRRRSLWPPIGLGVLMLDSEFFCYNFCCIMSLMWILFLLYVHYFLFWDVEYFPPCLRIWKVLGKHELMRLNDFIDANMWIIMKWNWCFNHWKSVLRQILRSEVFKESKSEVRKASNSENYIFFSFLYCGNRLTHWCNQLHLK